MVKWIKVLWIGASILVLAMTLYGFDGKADSDIGVFFAWCMLFLSYPVGLLVPLGHTALYEVFSITFESSCMSFVFDWAGFTLLGFCQWFKFVPYIVCNIRKLKGARKEEQGHPVRRDKSARDRR